MPIASACRARPSQAVTRTFPLAWGGTWGLGRDLLEITPNFSFACFCDTSRGAAWDVCPVKRRISVCGAKKRSVDGDGA